MNLYALRKVDHEGRVAYTVTSCNQPVISSSDRIIQYGLIDFFSPEDARKIAKSARLSGLPVANLSGQSMWVPISRLKYLPFFALAFGVSFTFAAPMYMYIGSFSVFGVKITAAQVIFPLMFVFTDLTNELFGYRIVKSCIQYLAFLLVIMAVLTQLALFLEVGDTIQRSLPHLPKVLVIDAVCLLIADTFNAYLFAKLKNWMQGQQLWLRSLCSSCFASMTYSLAFDIVCLSLRWQWSGPEGISISHVIVTIIFKLPYFIAFLPIIYGICNYIRNQEAQTFANMGDADLLDDHAIRVAERKDLWD